MMVSTITEACARVFRTQKGKEFTPWEGTRERFAVASMFELSLEGRGKKKCSERERKSPVSLGDHRSSACTWESAQECVSPREVSLPLEPFKASLQVMMSLCKGSE